MYFSLFVSIWFFIVLVIIPNAVFPPGFPGFCFFAGGFCIFSCSTFRLLSWIVLFVSVWLVVSVSVVSDRVESISDAVRLVDDEGSIVGLCSISVFVFSH